MRNRQRGIGYIAIMILIALVAFLIKVITVAAPPYIDNFYMDSAIKGVLKDSEANNSSIGDIKAALSSRFQINNITDQSPSDLTYSKEGNAITVGVDYEVRKPFIGNMDVVMKFKKSYSSEENAGSN